MFGKIKYGLVAMIINLSNSIIFIPMALSAATQLIFLHVKKYASLWDFRKSWLTFGKVPNMYETPKNNKRVLYSWIFPL